MTKNLSKPILENLRKQIKETGSGLVKLDSREHAEKMYKWLENKLPEGFGVWIIDVPGRENEINVYRIIDSNSDTGRTFDWLNSRPSKTTKMPAKFKSWKKSKGL